MLLDFTDCPLKAGDLTGSCRALLALALTLSKTLRLITPLHELPPAAAQGPCPAWCEGGGRSPKGNVRFMTPSLPAVSEVCLFLSVFLSGPPQLPPNRRECEQTPENESWYLEGLRDHSHSPIVMGEVAFSLPMSGELQAKGQHPPPGRWGLNDRSFLSSLSVALAPGGPLG